MEGAYEAGGWLTTVLGLEPPAYAPVENRAFPRCSVVPDAGGGQARRLRGMLGRAWSLLYEPES